MRVVPHSEALQLVQVPAAERLAETDGLVRQSFGELVERRVILGAFPFGSAQSGDMTSAPPGFRLTSDYDLFVSVPDGDASAEAEAFREIHRAAKDIYTSTGVPLEIDCYTELQFAHGLHSLPDGMVAWLRTQRQRTPHNVVGADFVNGMPLQSRLGSPDHLIDLDTFADRIRRGLKKTWWQGYSPQPDHALGLVLNVPYLTGRKVMDVLKSVGVVQQEALTDLTRPTIASAIFGVFGPESEIGALYREIDHDALLGEQFVHEASALNEAEYRQMVEGTLEVNLPKAIELLRRLHEGCRSLANNVVAPDAVAYTVPYTERGMNRMKGAFWDDPANGIMPGVDRRLIQAILERHPGRRYRLTQF